MIRSTHRIVGNLGIVAVTLALASPAVSMPPDSVRQAPRLADVVVSPADIADGNRVLQDWGTTTVPGLDLFKTHPFQEPLSARSMILPPSWLERPAGYNSLNGVDAALFKKDVEYLQILLKHVYGGYSRAERFGWKWDTFFAEWTRSLDAKGDSIIPFSDAIEPLNAFKRFQIDNHTNFIMIGPSGLPTNDTFDAFLRSFVDPSQNYLLTQVPLGRCSAETTTHGDTIALPQGDEGQQPRKTLIPNDASSGLESAWTVSAPTSRDLASITCGTETISLTKSYVARYPERLQAIASMEGQSSETAAVRRLAPDAAYIRFPTFGEGTCQTSQQLVVPPEFGKEHLLVVDIRNNHGGDFLGCAGKTLAPWVNVVESEVIKFNVHKRRSCIDRATIGIRDHEKAWMPAAEEILRKGLRPELATAIQEDTHDILALESDASCAQPDFVQTSPVTFREHNPQRFFDAPADQLRVIVLMDNYCASDCELAVQYLGLNFPSLLVGSNTLGMMQFTVPRYTYLPFTGTQVRMAEGVSDLFGDDRSMDGFGIPVDVLLPSATKQSAENLTKLILSLAKK